MSHSKNHSAISCCIVVVLAIFAFSTLDLRAIDIGPMTWTPRADWVNVKSCKAITGGPDAVGDGVADDTAALQAVCTWLQNRSSPMVEQICLTDLQHLNNLSEGHKPGITRR